jgi:transcriptional regulator with XRE-family HTH domain
MSSGLGISPGQRAGQRRIDEELTGLITQLTNEISWYLGERDISRAELAARMGVSPGRVSQILGGGENFTLRTLAAMSTALDAGFAAQLHALKPEDGFTSSNTADRP